jgi:hypothetical protein
MKKKALILGFLFVFSSIFLLFSETAEDRLLKKREQRILNYTYQARNGNRILKSSVLDSVLGEFDESKYSSSDRKLVELVVYLSEEGTIRQEFENNSLINDYPEVRRKSCQVLAKLGGDEARKALIGVLLNDSNLVVKSEACIALSQVKDNSAGDALRAIIYSYRATFRPDQNFVMAIISSVKLIARGDSLAFGDAMLILSEIQLGQYNKVVRDEAYAAIQYLNSQQ